MLLGDFIKELKHNSLIIKLFSLETSRDQYIFNGSLGLLKNNIHYQEKWSKYKIFNIMPYYDSKMRNIFQIELITIQEVLK